jgi:hypothetical protein
VKAKKLAYLAESRFSVDEVNSNKQRKNKKKCRSALRDGFFCLILQAKVQNYKLNQDEKNFVFNDGVSVCAVWHAGTDHSECLQLVGWVSALYRQSQWQQCDDEWYR